MRGSRRETPFRLWRIPLQNRRSPAPRDQRPFKPGEIAGPERAPFNEIIARYLKAVGDPREVVRDPEVRYWGGRVEERSLVPLGEARLGRIGFDEWLRRSQARA
jgi:uncharacterized protein YbjT (DUF2867 family)